MNADGAVTQEGTGIAGQVGGVVMCAAFVMAVAGGVLTIGIDDENGWQMGFAILLFAAAGSVLSIALGWLVSHAGGAS